MNIYGEYFYGNKISDYGLKYGFVDYGTLAKAFDAVLNNTIFGVGWEIGEWEQLSGYIDNTAELEELQEQIDELQELEELTEEQENKLQELQDNYTDLEYEQDETPEIYQFYIVDERGADLLQEVNEIVYYNNALDVYLWGVTHYGTSWSYVLTNIPCNTGKFE